MLEGFVPAGGAWGVESWLGSQQNSAQAVPDEPMVKDTRAPEDATFETLKDGSTALIVTPGKRLRLDLSALLEGGDTNKEQREKEARRRRKRRSKFLGAWGGFGSFGATTGADGKNLRGFGGKDSPPAAGASGGDVSAPLWQGGWKEWVNEYTVTMDVKIQEPPREGLALYQTALVHAEEHKGQGNARGRLKQSDGEAIISPAGGVGILGYFGDTKAHVKADRWVRVAVSVKCSADSKQKGEIARFFRLRARHHSHTCMSFPRELAWPLTTRAPQAKCSHTSMRCLALWSNRRPSLPTAALRLIPHRFLFFHRRSLP